MKILIAEDDPTSRKLLELSLKQWGHDCTTAADGKEALEAWSKQRFDVLVTDWMMPEIDGISLIRAIRAAEARKGLYTWCVLLTTKVFRENYTFAMEAGVDDFLMKPLDRELLRVRLYVAARILKMRKQIQDAEAMIPICMRCKAVRNSPDQWQKIEEYLAHHVPGSLSHGYCPDCFLADSVLPEVKRLEEKFGRPVPTGRLPVDPAALAFLRAHEADSPGLATDLGQAFSQLAHDVERRLQTGALPAAATRLHFQEAASAIGAYPLEQALRQGDSPGVTRELAAVLASPLIASPPSVSPAIALA